MPPGRPKIRGLTPRQTEVMQEFIFYEKTYEKSPSLREVARRLVVAPPTLHEILRQLMLKGYLRRDGHGPHSPYIIIKRVASGSRVKKPVRLLGKIPCGPPTEPITDDEGISVMVDSSVTRNGSFFALRLDGDSMRDIGYDTGDVVIIRRQQLAEDGDVVAAVVNGEATLKRLIYRDNRIALKAENSRFATLEVTCEDEFRIIGKVVCHIRERNIVYGKQQSSKNHQSGVPPLT